MILLDLSEAEVTVNGTVDYLTGATISPGLPALTSREALRQFTIAYVRCGPFLNLSKSDQHNLNATIYRLENKELRKLRKAGVNDLEPQPLPPPTEL